MRRVAALVVASLIGGGMVLGAGLTMREDRPERADSPFPIHS